MKYVLGLDQGGTKTNAAIADLQGNLLGLGTAQGSLHTYKGLPHATEALKQAIEQALAQAGVQPEDLLCVAGGITGIDYEYERVLLTDTVRALVGGEDIRLYNDCIGALWAGTFEIPAVVCCAGTGLNVGGVASETETLVLGNYCDGSHQGGGAIGRAALKAVFDAYIGKGPKTSLTEKLLTLYDLPDVDALLFKYCRKKDIATKELCPVVFEAAGEGDEVARALLVDMGTNLAQYIHSVIRMMHMEAPRVPVILSGGAFKGRPDILTEVIIAYLQQHCPQALVQQGRFEPVVGGIVTALYSHGAPGWQARLTQSAKHMGLERP